MTRWIAASAGALAVTLAVGLAMPLGNEAMADGMRAPAAAVFKNKRCIAPPMRWGLGLGRGSGQPVTWVCKIEERCCYDRVLRQGNCLAPTDRCF